MKRTVSMTAAFAAIALLATLPAARADDPAASSSPAPSASAPQRKDIMGQFADLNLTDDQKAKLRPILMNAKSQMQAIRTDTTLTDDQRKEKQRQLHRDTLSQIMSILTDDQKAKWKAAHPGFGDGGIEKPHGPMADLAYLNLTSDQQSQLDKIKAGARTQLDAIKADTTLTDEQKKAKAKPIYMAAVEQFVAILTPDQQKLFRDHQQQNAPSAPK